MSQSPFDPSSPQQPGPYAGSPQPPQTPPQYPSTQPAHAGQAAYGVGPAPQAQFGPPPEGQPGATPPARRSRRGLVAGAVALAVVLVGGTGAVAAYQKLAPKGAQPDTVIPASAVAFVRLDLDPSAGQKISATRFLSKLPKVAKDGDAVDLKKTLWDYAVQAEPDLKSLDYATDVEPWLGDRAGLAVLPGGTADKPNLVIALETTDTGKAKTGIEKVAKTGGGTGDDLEVTTKDDYALITPKGNGAGVLSELAKGSLASSSTYTKDLGDLGDSGIASAWVDGKGVSQLASTLGGTTAGGAGSLDQLGRVAVALRFDADYVELAGITRGATVHPTTAPPAGGAASLPANTMVALQLGGLGDSVQQAWPQLQKAIPGGASALSDVEQQLGVTLPDDLVTLLGSSLTLSMPKQDLTQLGSELPTVGAKILTKDPSRAEALVTKLTTSAGADGVVKHQATGDSLFLATTDDYLKAVQQKGTLGGSDLFTKAVAEPDKATAVAFADLGSLKSLYADAPADAKPLLESLTAVGLSATQGTDGSGSFALRVVGQ